MIKRIIRFRNTRQEWLRGRPGHRVRARAVTPDGGSEQVRKEQVDDVQVDDVQVDGNTRSTR